MSWSDVLAGGPNLGVLAFLLSVLVVALLLLLRKPQERRSTLIVTGFFLFCVIGALVARLLEGYGATDAAVYVRWVSVFGEGLCIIRLAGIGMFRGVLPAVRLQPPQILQEVLMALAYIVWGLLWSHANGMNPASILTTAGLLTAVLAFSLQDTLGNILGGLALQIDKSVSVGDWIKVGDITGRVVETTWRQTSIETRNWETLVIPNSLLVKNQFLVLGRRAGQPVQWRRWIWFNVDFRYSPTQVIETVTEAIRTIEIPNVAHEPTPSCLLMDMHDSYARYGFRYWLTDLVADDPTDSAVRTHIYFALKRKGIPLSIPAQAVFVTSESRERDEAKLRRGLASRTDVFHKIELFRHLSDEEMQQYAEHLIPAPFAPGDIITRQGAEAHWLYLVRDGWVDIVVMNEHGHSSKVAELGPGSFVGEMALMTGQPRSATVIARTEVDCYRLAKESFREIIASRPAVAEEIAALLAERQTKLTAIIQNLNAADHAPQLAAARHDILQKVRRFFGLT